MNVKHSTRKLTAMAIMIAISVVLVYFIHIPIFPQVAFLEYDPADISILICGFAFGPIAGICVTIIASLIQGLTVSAQSGVYGILMHIIATGAFVLVSSLIYRKHKSKKAAAIALACGVAAMVIVMIPANIFITPYFMGVPRKLVVELLGFIVAFNAIKAGVNAILTFLLYKSVSKLFKHFEIK
ncbi:MAG: ECF transporter S component [Ruminococcaceae bacterium]|nr:ECF transporter S component [Oscillospiraceae bacterium]